MGTRILTKGQSGTGLLRQFAILSLIVGLITMALSLVISYYLRKDLLEREWRITADFTRTEALFHLTPRDFAAPMTSQAQEHFKIFYEQTVMMPEIVRVKIYDATMAVVWSDEPRLIGQRFPDNSELANALAGRTMVNLHTEQKGENIYEQDAAGRLVEVYVPIVFPGTAPVAGVVETYKSPEQVFVNIRRGQLVVAGTALAGGFLLYASLFWIVRRAARGIERQRALTAHLQAVREADRARVAQEIHDELGHGLTGLKMDLVWLAPRLSDDPPGLREKAKQMLALVDTTIHAARRIFTDLRPAVLDDLGLVAALEWQAQDFEARTGLPCRFASDEDHLVLDPGPAMAVFRICQESLTNIARHAGATGVTIRLERLADSLRLTVEDNGRGITDSEVADPKSLGLLGMRERALLLGGELVVTGAPGKGTTVTLTVPLKRPPVPT